MTIFKENILEIANKYQYFILDVWGVIHDGDSAYDGVVDCVKKLKEMGKKIAFLSNAPRRSSVVAKVLADYGITEDYYEFILTSGEAAHFYLQQNQQDGFKEFKKKYFYIGPQKDRGLVNDLEYEEVLEAKDADFNITTGFNGPWSTLDERQHQLDESIKYNLPMICVNPDLMVIKKTGQEFLCAGVLAQEYQKMQGKVHFFGKPHNEVYKILLQKLNISDLSQAIAIGDGMETDILGANKVGIDCALIAGGILSNRVGVKYGKLPEEEKIAEVFAEYGFKANYVIGGLQF
jgi:HAD superfamily hydrolase (TIGR01459 family)